MQLNYALFRIYCRKKIFSANTVHVHNSWKLTNQNRIYVTTTAAFTYYYDPVILRNKLTPLSISRDLALRKRDSKNLCFTFRVL